MTRLTPVHALMLMALTDCGARSELGAPLWVDGGEVGGADVAHDAPNVSYVPLLASDGRHSCYRGRTGALACWGGSPNGVLADDGGFAAAPTPQLVAVNSVPIIVSARGTGQCVLLSDGTIDCWGWDSASFKLLGDGAGKSQSPPGVAVFTAQPI